MESKIVNEGETDQLVFQAQNGDESAKAQLLMRHQDRLKRMIAVFLDPRVSPRVDPSDVLQETLVAAAKRMKNYQHNMPGGFYPWLRQIAKDRIIDAHRCHIRAGKRSVEREIRDPSYMSAASASRLADRMVSNETSPSAHAGKKERRGKILAALNLLPDSYRELLLMRYMEQLSVKEISAVLCDTESAIKSRLWRALEKMNSMVDSELGEFE